MTRYDVDLHLPGVEATDPLRALIQAGRQFGRLPGSRAYVTDTETGVRSEYPTPEARPEPRFRLPGLGLLGQALVSARGVRRWDDNEEAARRGEGDGRRASAE